MPTCRGHPLPYKVNITNDLRLYSAPARGSKSWKMLYKERTAVERVNAYLKEFFQLNHIRYRTGKRAKVHFDLVHLVYNATRLAIDRLNDKKTRNKQPPDVKFLTRCLFQTSELFYEELL